jgi:hypothetical protein
LKRDAPRRGCTGIVEWSEGAPGAIVEPKDGSSLPTPSTFFPGTATFLTALKCFGAPVA